MREQFLAPSGYYIVVAPDVSGKYWYVRVLDFATWKHRRDEFTDESAARREADKWRL